MRLEEMLTGLYHVNFPTQRELAETFLRFSEYNESSEFKGKVFTLDTFEEWYIKNSVNGKKTGRFTYYEDWDGFNIPSSALEPFYDGRFRDISKMERRLLHAFEDKKDSKFYILGTFGGGSAATLRHEMAHGLYFLDQNYRTEVSEALNLMSGTERRAINNFLKIGNYNPSVFEDETHAYLLDRRCLGRNGVSGEGIAKAGRAIKKIFKKYYEMHRRDVKEIRV